MYLNCPSCRESPTENQNGTEESAASARRRSSAPDRPGGCRGGVVGAGRRRSGGGSSPARLPPRPRPRPAEERTRRSPAAATVGRPSWLMKDSAALAFPCPLLVCLRIASGGRRSVLCPDRPIAAQQQCNSNSAPGRVRRIGISSSAPAKPAPKIYMLLSCSGFPAVGPDLADFRPLLQHSENTGHVRESVTKNTMTWNILTSRGGASKKIVEANQQPTEKRTENAPRTIQK